MFEALLILFMIVIPAAATLFVLISAMNRAFDALEKRTKDD